MMFLSKDEKKIHLLLMLIMTTNIRVTGNIITFRADQQRLQVFGEAGAFTIDPPFLILYLKAQNHSRSLLILLAILLINVLQQEELQH